MQTQPAMENLVALISNTTEYFQKQAQKQVNTTLTIRNWLIGFYIVEYEQSGKENSIYGSKLLVKLSKKLKSLGLKGLDDRALRSCRIFYLYYPQIWGTVTAELEKSTFKDQSNWLTVSANLKFSSEKNAILINMAFTKPEILLSKLTLKCHILVDLKIGEFSHADAGQMNLYLNYFKAEENAEEDRDPIGIILCAGKNELMVKYATGNLSQKIFVSKYMINLPTEKELEAIIIEEKNKHELK